MELSGVSSRCVFVDASNGGEKVLEPHVERESRTRSGAIKVKSCSVQAKDYFLIVKCVRDRKTWIHQLIKIYSDFILKKVLIKPDKSWSGIVKLSQWTTSGKSNFDGNFGTILITRNSDTYFAEENQNKFWSKTAQTATTLVYFQLDDSLIKRQFNSCCEDISMW